MSSELKPLIHESGRIDRDRDRLSLLLRQINNLAEHEKAQLLELLLGSDGSRMALSAISSAAALLFETLRERAIASQIEKRS
jgi:hypothetical protein